MTVDQVALWVGLLASVVAIVLSVVAIWFAVWVNGRSERVDRQTIASLTEIKSLVDMLRTESFGLVRAGWDRFVTGQTPHSPVVEPTKEIAAGAAREISAELAKTDPTDTSADRRLARIEELVKDLERSVASAAAPRVGESSHEVVERMFDIARRMSPEAQMLFRAIRPHHLTRDQYKRIARSTLSQPVQELRRNGLLVPLTGHTTGDSEEKQDLVYYYPPTLRNYLPALSALLPQVPLKVAQKVWDELSRVNYPVLPPRPEAKRKDTGAESEDDSASN